MAAKAIPSYQLKMPDHEHVLWWDKDLDQKLQHCCSGLNWIRLEISSKNLGPRNYPTYFLFVRSVPFCSTGLLANQSAVVQIVARAKKRPDSGVTVIGVPKTADTCSEVIT